MKVEMILSRQWILVGAISGILANLLFPLLILVSLPDYLSIFLAELFGLLYSLTGFAIHHLMKYDRPSILTQIGALFIFVAGIIFNGMLAIQLTFKGYLHHYQSQAEEQDIDLLNWIAKTVDPVHLGLQLSNDFFVAIAMLLFAIEMFNHRFFGKIWSLSGTLIALLLLGVKCYAFPFTPYELGFPYIFGPLVAGWFLGVCIQCLRCRRALL